MKSETSEHPIIFSGAMARAILEGRKSQTRRVIKPQPKLDNDGFLWWHWNQFAGSALADVKGAPAPAWIEHCPYGAPGTRLWVREAWAICHDDHDNVTVESAMHDARDAMPWCSIVYSADANGGYAGEHLVGNRARPSIHMPRWASRLTLEVTEVRVQRVAEISAQDCIAEGVTLHVNERGAPLLCISGSPMPNAFSDRHPLDWKVEDYWRHEYARLWDSINAKRGYGWEANPWVFAISFKVVTP